MASLRKPKDCRPPLKQHAFTNLRRNTKALDQMDHDLEKHIFASGDLSNQANQRVNDDTSNASEGEVHLGAEALVNVLRAKDEEISALTGLLHEERLTHQFHMLDITATLKDSQEECKTLQAKLDAMERFLLDYGMKWVGDSHKSNEWKLKDKQSPRDTRDSGHQHLDMVLFEKAITELNLLAGDMVEAASSDRRGALKVVCPLNLRIYEDGIVLENAPFRSFEESDVQLFVRDILDGYFPYELKHAFPDGVPFKLIDYSGMTHTDALVQHRWGQGQVLGKMPNAQQLPSAEKPQDPEVLIVDLTPTTCGRAPTTTLQVRTQCSRNVYLLKMLASATVQDLHSALRERCFAEDPRAFEVRSPFPRQTYADMSLTLETAGLTPNANLIVQFHTDQVAKAAITDNLET